MINNWEDAMKKILGIFTTLIAISSLLSVSFCGNDYTGHSVYRDGVVGDIVWHAGVVVSENQNVNAYPIVQASGYRTYISRVSVSDFNYGNNFMGVYRNNCIGTQVGRSNVANMAKTLTYYNISYTVFNLMSADVNPTRKIEPSDIWQMRCDGVVEYCNDYYGYNFECGDISSYSGYNQTQGWQPKTQSDYLSWISSNLLN